MIRKILNCYFHGLRTPREEIAFTARPKIQSQSQIFRYGRSIFCLPHRPNLSDIFDLCLHWVSVVRECDQSQLIICDCVINENNRRFPILKIDPNNTVVCEPFFKTKILGTYFRPFPFLSLYLRQKDSCHR